MLVKQSYKDVPTKANGKEGTIRIYIIEPNVPEYPEAKFPGCQFVHLPLPPGLTGRCRLFRNLSSDGTCREVRQQYRQ